MEEAGLPRGLCRCCSEEAIAAANFRQLCTESTRQWNQATHSFLLDDPEPQDKAYYIFYHPDGEIVVRDQIRRVSTTGEALHRLTETIRADQPPKPKRKRKRFPLPRSALVSHHCKCPECEREFSTAYHFNAHVKKTTRRVCYHCATIMSREDLPRHLSEFHDMTFLHCIECYKLFSSEMDLCTHSIEAHGAYSHACQHCGASFNNERALRAHMFTHSLFHCDACGRSYENRKCFKYHKRLCRGSPKPAQNLTYVCNECGNQYDKKPSLRIHIIQKHLNVLPFVCATCGKRTSTLAHLKSHQMVHKAQRKMLECLECGVKLRTELGMVLHRRIHTGEKPFVCSHCGEKFLSASRRLDHYKRRHMSSNEAPHGCALCPARFVRPFELRKHVANVHVVKTESDIKMPTPARMRIKKEYLLEERLCPAGVCVACVSATLQAHELRSLVLRSAKAWSETLRALEGVPLAPDSKTSSIIALVNGDELNVVNSSSDPKTALEKLRTRLSKKPRQARKPRVARNGPTCCCDDCGKSFSNPHYLNLHLQNSAQKEACNICGLIFIRGEKLKGHLLEVHNRHFHLCSKCPLIFPNVTEAHKHEKNAHKSGVHTCSHCGRTFPRQSSFDAHAQMHAVRTCRACGKQFANRACYREHRSQCEPDAKPDTRLMRRDLRSNIRDPAVYICDYCGKNYLSRPQLKNHITWIHMNVRPHQCQWCGKRFYTAARLLEHTVVHTRERNFPCDICSAKLVTKMALVYHRRRHTGEKPYECTDCGERFLSASRRSEHGKRRHGKGTMFQCALCTHSFVRGHELRKHMERVHRSNAQSKQPPTLTKIKSEQLVVAFS